MPALLAMGPPMRPLKKIRLLSMGAGVQTTALMIRYAPTGRYQYVVFADTGAELPGTYEYVEKWLKPFAQKCGVPWITVRHETGLDIDDWMFRKRTVPIKRTRNCTRDFKIRPIQTFAKSLGATELNPVYEDLGISWDEYARANPTKYDVDYLIKQYPFVDEKITRNDCYQIIEQHGWPRPPKSGCDFCPFKPRKWFHELAAARPERFQELIKLEMNDKKYPRFPLDGRAPLNLILNADKIDEEKAVLATDATLGGGCGEAYCGV